MLLMEKKNEENDHVLFCRCIFDGTTAVTHERDYLYEESTHQEILFSKKIP